jgi:hypothetical protein
MKESVVKYIPSFSRKIIFSIGIGIGIFFFIYIYFHSNKLVDSLLISSGFSAILTLFFLISEYLDNREHKTILYKRNFIRIKDHFDFEIENKGNYWGYKGTYNGYFIRLFYDNLVRGGRLGILIYYDQPRNSAGKVDLRFLDNINDKFEIKGMFKSVTRLYDTSHIRIFTTGYINRRAKKVISIIEQAVYTLEKVKLKPISESRVDELVANDSYIHTPLTATYESYK